MSDIEDKLRELVENQQDIPPEFARVLDEHFWDLIGDDNERKPLGDSETESRESCS